MISGQLEFIVKCTQAFLYNKPIISYARLFEYWPQREKPRPNQPIKSQGPARMIMFSCS